MTTESQQRAIMAAVDAAFERQVEFTSDLIRVPSLRGSEKAGQDVMEKAMREAGLSIDRWTLDPAELDQHEGAGAAEAYTDEADVVIGTFNPQEPTGRSLILNGHIDVVPTGVLDFWSRSPWDPAVIDGWLYGRGSADMKAGLVANLFAFTAVRAAGYKPQGRIHIQSVPEEESTGNGTVSALQRGYVADTVIISEPSRTTLIRAHVGVIWFTARVTGKAAHVSEMGVGGNAIDAAYALIAELRKLEERWNDDASTSVAYGSKDHPINMNIGTISGGDWTSTVPDWCEFSVRVAVLPENDVNDAWREIQECVEQAAATNPTLEGKAASVRKSGFFANGYFLEEGSSAEDVLTAAHWSSSGEALDELIHTGYLDSRVYGLYAGVPALVYGPIGARLHGADEAVNLDSLKRVTKSLALFIADWCGIIDESGSSPESSGTEVE